MTALSADDACCATCATPANDTALAIACTLDAADFRDRVADIRALAARSLIRSERRPLQLVLTYEAGARADVEELVPQESSCCAFLDFALYDDVGAVRLTITAPFEALAAADELFAHFAPDLARVAA